jgi:hypothetical protein
MASKARAAILRSMIHAYPLRLETDPMITNIIDKRKRRYRFLKINAVVEAAWHDNAAKDSDRAPSCENDGPAYEEREHIALSEAVTWASAFAEPVTLFLYDEDAGITEPGDEP